MGFAIRVELGLGDGAGGKEGGGVGGGRWGVRVELQQPRGWFLKDNEAISSAWKCLLL